MFDITNKLIINDFNQVILLKSLTETSKISREISLLLLYDR